MKYFFTLVILCAFPHFIQAQQLNIQEENNVQYEVDTVWVPLFGNVDIGISALTPVADKLGRPYVYVASNQGGLRIFETSNMSLVAELDTFDLHQVSSTVFQEDEILYIGSGSIFGDSLDTTGLITVDVSIPSSPVILDKWFDPNKTVGLASGTGVIRVKDGLAYIGGMAEGLIILDVSNPSNISFVSKLTPSITFPFAGNGQEKVNARGMSVEDSLVYLCYDAGGVRVINCADPFNPVQIGEFANDITYAQGNQPRAYNNIVIRDTLAYVASDYCGLEIWSVDDPTNAQLLTHWNPVPCPGPTWWGAHIHTNELVLKESCDLLFISTGHSDLQVLDVADPYNPVPVDSFGTVLDTGATWGLDVTDEHIYLTYVYTGTWLPSLLVPFYSNWNGVKKLSYEICNLGQKEENLEVAFYPNPADENVTIELDGRYHYEFRDNNGSLVFKSIGEGAILLDVQGLAAGLYHITIEQNGKVSRDKLVIE